MSRMTVNIVKYFSGNFYFKLTVTFISKTAVVFVFKLMRSFIFISQELNICYFCCPFNVHVRLRILDDKSDAL